MNAGWYLLEQGSQPASYNMALDEALLQCAPELGRPVLRFYGWREPSATFGYAQKYSEVEKMTRLRPLIRRPTGGGLVPHDADWTYSLVFPAGHFWHGLKAVESYHRVHQWIRDAFARMQVETSLAPAAQKEIPGQCFVGCEKSDIVWGGRKIAGAAQRRTRTGLLIQGSIQPPPIPLAREKWQAAMCAIDGHPWTALEISAPLAEIVQALEKAKYAQPGYNQKR
jgi:lipoate-protein ligase A